MSKKGSRLQNFKTLNFFDLINWTVGSKILILKKDIAYFLYVINGLKTPSVRYVVSKTCLYAQEQRMSFEKFVVRYLTYDVLKTSFVRYVVLKINV